MFPDLPSFIPNDARRQAALVDIAKPGGIMDARDNLAVGPVLLITDPAQSVNNRDNPTHTAGTTFFGQFLDHDMTFDTTSPLGVATAAGAHHERPHSRAGPGHRVRPRPGHATRSSTTPPTR